MIRVLRKVALRSRLINTIKYKSSDQKDRQIEERREEAIIEGDKDVALMEDNFEKVKMKGLQERDITGVDDFQRQILEQNQFDLLDPKINPKVASLSTTMGLQLGKNQMLAQVSLGKIKVKKENQVFLSEVDPNSIPEYYDIVFDFKKEMSLVGKQTQSEGEESSESEMEISTRKAFQERSRKELSDQVMGLQVDVFVHSRLAWKGLVFALLFSYFLTFPFIITWVEVFECKNSIEDVQNERVNQIHKIKREALGSAILNNTELKLI